MANALNLRAGFPPTDVQATLTLANFTLDQTTDQFEVSFQPQSAITITRLGIRLGAITGTSPTYKISLQGSDASGDPDGTIKGGASPASATFNPSSLGWTSGTWHWLTLDNSYTCARGDQLQLVVAYDSGTINASNCISITTNMTGSGVVLSHQPRSTQNNAGSRSHQQTVAIYGYGSAGTAYGHPLSTVGETSNTTSATTPDEIGNIFTIPSGWADTFQIVGVRCGVKPPTGSTFNLTLYDTDGTTVLQQATFDSDLRQSSANIHWTMIFDEVTLSTLNCGSAYRIAIAPQDTGVYTLAQLTVDAAADMAAWDMGQNFYLTSRTDAGAWTDDQTKRIVMELIFADITKPAGGGSAAYILGC